MTNIEQQKIAIIYDWLDSWGGVERVLLIFHELFPTADFYTSYVDLNAATWAQNLQVKPSFIQQLPGFIKKNRILSLPLYPYAFESFDLSEYDVVISVSSAFAKSVVTKPHTKHLCYLLTPPRYLWGQTESYSTGAQAIIAAPLLGQLRSFDFVSAQRPDRILAISQTIADRCATYYQRSSDVLYPPFDIRYWQNVKRGISNISRPKKEKYHLVISRLEPYKNVELVISTFNQSKEHLVVIGKGRLKKNLMQKAGNTITFLEDLSDHELAIWYSYAESLIMPQEEDFGYVALEARFMGCPVIAFQAGGARETVKDGETGVFFASQSQKSLEEALERLQVSSYNVRHTLRSTESFPETFSKDHFIKKIQDYCTGIL